MESPGKYLKAERELRKLSLEEVAEFTKIREPLLRAIEEDGYKLLPPSFYVKGFLVAYARFLGLDPNEVILRYPKHLEDTGISKEKPVSSPHLISSPRKNIKAWLFFVSIFVIILFIVFFTYYIPH